MKIAICDDEMQDLSEYRKRIAGILEKNKIVAKIELFQSAKELMFAMEDEAEEIDVLFLDINMPEMSGVEVAHWIREKKLTCEIIFLTVSREHMLSAFDVGALHYVVKGLMDGAKLEEICLKAVEKVSTRNKEVITVSCAGESRRIPIEDILYFEVQNYIIIVYYGDTKFEFYSTLGKIENQLLSRGFVRTHRSYLVNLQQVRAVMRQELELTNGEKVPVGRKYAEEVRLLLQKQSESKVDEIPLEVKG